MDTVLTADAKNTSEASYLKVRRECIHCSTPFESIDGNPFCCNGCRMVHALLKNRGLDRYYELKKKGRSIRKPIPATRTDEPYSYLDEPEFLKLYSAGGDRRMQFYLEGVHCAACVWLTERVGEFVPGVQSIRLDLGNSVATVRLGSTGSFSEVAREFALLGYRPHPVKQGDEDDLLKKENRTMLIRIGVAGAAAGNIMLLAVCLYGGLSGKLATWFNWVSLGLFLPVFFYSAAPFYRSAWAAIRAREVSIDIPVVLGIVSGGMLSLFNLLSGSSRVYFDSLSALVFLLLVSRYFLRRTQQSALTASKLIHFLTPSYARRRDESGYRQVQVHSLRAGDVVRVLAGECIPADGVVSSGTSAVNCSLLTGEPLPELVTEGARVFAGTVNQDAPLEIRVLSSPGASRLGEILRSMEEGLKSKARLVEFTDRISRVFVTAVVILAGLVFVIGLRHGFHEAVNRALALVLVTCPCALALATPLAMSMAIGRCARAGILVRGSMVIEKLSRIKSVFLDKTGTLTWGQLEVSSWSVEPGFPQAQQVALALESRSNHPIAKAIVRKLSRNADSPGLEGFEVRDFHETIGYGVAGRIEGELYEMRRASEERPSGSLRSGATEIGLYCNGKRIALAVLEDRLREESAAAIRDLRALGIEPWILSGDARSSALAVASKLGIPESQVVAEASPEVKSRIMKLHPRAAMVGDGANDVVALADSYVGIAVHGGMEASIRAADAYSSRSGVVSVTQLAIVSRETMRVIHRNFLFSLLYNLIGGTAAMLGWVSPLLGAVLMPLSALTVFVSSFVGTRKMRDVLS